MAKPNIAELKVIAADLQKQCDYENKMSDLLCVTGEYNSNKGEPFCSKSQRKTAKRKERRNKSSSNSLSNTLRTSPTKN